VDYLQQFFYFCYAGVLLTLAGVLMRLSGLHSAVYTLQLGLGVCLLALAAFLLAEITGRYTPGANDNGTGVALALWLASDYAAHRAEYPADCELRFLFTGCEEAGERGMKAFLQAHRGELNPARTMFVNLDNLGTGDLTYLTGEGMLLYRKAGPTLLRLARQMAGDHIREQKNLLLPTDALPVSALGFQAISFLGKDRKGRMGHYHWHTDTFENVDHEFLRFQQGFFREYVQRAMAAGG
jgi:Zn-dependent M28 family amino/carboxypeptidase